MSKEILNEIIEWVKTIATALILAFVITIFITPTIVRGESMMPTLQNKNYLIINKTAYWFSKPQRGDIIVFKSHLKDDDGKEKDLVKRVIGLPLDHVVIKDGLVYVNDILQNEDYINGEYTDGDIDIIVPSDEIFAMGDNRQNSLDSRSSQVGTIDIKESIIGKVVVRLYPLDKITNF